MAIPTVCWLLLGFFGKRVQDGRRTSRARCRCGSPAVLESIGLVPDHRIVKRSLNVLFIGLFVAWVAWGVFDVPFEGAWR